MKSVPVNLYYWKPTKDDKQTGLKILTAIEGLVQKKFPEAQLTPKEYTMSVEVPPLSPTPFSIVFGSLARGQLDNNSLLCYIDVGNVQDLHPKANKSEARKKAWRAMQVMANDIIAYYDTQSAATASHVETPEGVTVGKADTDITVTDKEVEYLRQLKELLKGSKVVITKGDIKIEVE